MTQDLFERIRLGEFDLETQYPVTPRIPKLLLKSVLTLSSEEFDQIPKIKAEYQETLEQHRRERQNLRDIEERLKTQFWNALYEHFEVPIPNPFISKMTQLAWDMGQDNGHTKVALIFESMMPLWEMYKTGQEGSTS